MFNKRKQQKLLFALVFLVVATVASMFMSADEVVRPEEQQVVLRIDSWNDLIPLELYDQFEEETGIKVIPEHYTSPDQWYSKYLIDAHGQYDIVLLPHEVMMMMKAKNELRPIPELNNIYEDLIPGVKAPANRIGLKETALPVVVGMLGLIYDKESVSEEYMNEAGYDIYFDPQYKKKVTLSDIPSDLVVMSLLHNGYKPEDLNEDNYDQVLKYLVDLKQNILKFTYADSPELILTNSVDVIQGYPEVVFAVSGGDMDRLGVYFPKQTVAYSDSISISARTKYPEESLAFIEFLMRPENYKRIMDFLGMPSAYTRLSDEGRDIIYSSSMFEGERLNFRTLGSWDEYYFRMYNEIFIE